MLQLDRSSVVMNQHADNKAQALHLVADAMQKLGLADGFASFLLGREAVTSTYLGAGIAIPHGTPDAKIIVKKTGVAVVHFKNGVDWGDGETVYVAVGICAKSDEHLTILRQIARLLDNDHLEQQLKNATNADEVVALLSGQTVAKQLIEVPVFEQMTLQSANPDDLLKLAHRVLREQGVVTAEFAGGLRLATWLKWSDGVWCVQSQTGVQKTAVALVGAGSYQNQAVKVLAVIAQSVDNPYDAEELLIQLTHQEFASAHQEMATGTTVLLNEHGLHARPATFLSKLAGGYDGRIEIGFDGAMVSAKGLSRLLTLGATYGQSLDVSVTGADAQVWLTKILSAIDGGLGEQVMPIQAVQGGNQNGDGQDGINIVLDDEDEILSLPTPLTKGQPLTAQVACKGIGIGKAFVAKKAQFDYERASNDLENEQKLFAYALNKAKQNLNERIKTAKKPSIAEIFTAHLAMLDDEELIQAVNRRIAGGLSACGAVDDEIHELAKKQAALPNPILAGRASDWYDVGTQILAVLCGTSPVSMPDEPFVLIKADLLPSDVALLDDKVVAILTAQGGVNSHSAIIARSLGIPMLVSAGEWVLGIEQGEKVLVNGELGQFVVSPSQALVDETVTAQQVLAEQLAQAKLVCQNPAITTDGRHIEVAVNLGDVDSVATAVAQGAEGVGLLRTEFVFMKHSRMPDKDKQLIDYQKVFDEMGERPVVVRTLDVGGDKPLPYLPMPKEENPFLGVRGIRLSLTNPTTLKVQLTALVQASLASSQKLGLVQHKPLRIMFPMVSQIAELKRARAILDEVLMENPHNNLQVGIMVEVPSTAILADKFAPFVDFFSIGTNDLTQYTLAIDRGHPSLSALADGLDPSVLRFIELTVRAAQAFGKWVGVCGELAADSNAVPILVGLGVNELSVSASQIPLVKAQIRTLDFIKCKALADRALVADSGQAVRALVKAGVGG